MPSKSRSNAKKRRSSSRGAANGSALEHLLPERGSAVFDIVGVCIIVVAIAMVLALVSPSNAPVTKAVGEFLVLCFGVGALLCPISLIIFAATLFLGEDEPIGHKVALGLFLIIVSILGMISLTVPGTLERPYMVVAEEIVGSYGGYVGGCVAYALLSTVGRDVGYVILAGVIVVGAVICGFSISGAVARIRGKAEQVGDSIRLARERKREASLAESARGLQSDDNLADDDVEAPTSFIGSRRTSVLLRGRHSRGRVEDAPTVRLDDVQADGNLEATQPKTRLLRRKKHPDIDTDVTQPAIDFGGELAGEGEPLCDVRVQPEPDDEESVPAAVPDFIRNARSSRATVDKPHEDSAKRGKPAKQAVAKQKTTRAKASGSRPGDDVDGYELPPFNMLSSNPHSANAAASKEELDETRERLQGTLREFGLSSRVVDYISGPIVTTFRIEMGEGERVSRIKNLEDDIALTLAAEKVRIFAPIKGTSYVGVEIPNSKRSNVHLGDVLPYATGGPLEVAIGRDSAGKPVIADISKMPHMLVAGTTGSGKSVMINSMIMSILMRATPKQVRMIMVDPKRVEFSSYNGLPHLYVPVVTDPRQAASALQWAVSEMERRLKVFERAGARNILVYNEMCKTGKLSEMDNPPEPLPYIVVVVDELSDLMMTAGKDVEASIVRIAQLARAAGIHLVIATQRPSANVVTGLIKSNIDSRVGLKVASGIDSRVILDETGAERLLGNGDMLFKDRGLAPRRVLGCYTSDNEIEEVVSFIRDQAEPDYHEEILSQVVPGMPGGGREEVGEDDDPLVWEAAQIVVDSQLGSTSGLQRRLKVGYARAGRIMDMLEAKGVVGPPDGSKPREVLLDKEALEDLKTQEAKYREV
ncbi:MULTISPECIES: FtsK/SpoIIIE family DNA translocase [Atopobiaceae]|uniref:DNA segregation ATPase FtsK/SpoIIIE, S-DNA-T family n=1 Tax=Parafannyhessea umbonata TaxID=604330 RepID=A0A1H6JQD7_9ACTN|nr:MULTISPECIES: DNA translocase FtsK [Atopobiaceae]SEH61515.1 DNA segregation ATPase FtsK/SpoIIIE, S-DNA-T family [Parafannyhessea umbonata]SJZ79962.1 DNA segregation ATPase FtsK/SpoIIIE, S-DNA-T family [Olsenella sp. KH1P3]